MPKQSLRPYQKERIAGRSPEIAKATDEKGEIEAEKCSTQQTDSKQSDEVNILLQTGIIDPTESEQTNKTLDQIPEESPPNTEYSTGEIADTKEEIIKNDQEETVVANKTDNDKDQQKDHKENNDTNKTFSDHSSIPSFSKARRSIG